MKQGSLFEADVTEPVVELVVLTCPLGEKWIGPHPLCEAYGQALLDEFDRNVAAGVYDAEGYSKSDRKRQRKVAQHG